MLGDKLLERLPNTVYPVSATEMFTLSPGCSESNRSSSCEHSQPTPDTVRNSTGIHTSLLESFPSSHCRAARDGTLPMQ